MKYVIFLGLTFLSVSTWGQFGTKKVEFVGAARSEISNFGLKTDPAINDTTTPGKLSSGYALIDLGFKINPNSSTEIMGMIRIRNAFGGFWGSGVTFDVRQLYVRGVFANAFRYQIGNIDYKLTPYTFYNHNPDQLIKVNSVQKIKRDIIDYENFHTDNNTWRQQGASLDFGLEFSKLIKEIKINSFITRLNPSNNANLFERFYGGGNLIIKQSKHFTIGANHVSAFDLIGTANSTDAFRNNVSTLTYSIDFPQQNYKIGISGESGMSSIYKISDTTEHLSDYFFDNKIYFKSLKSNFDAALGFMSIGADFRSIGAQSKRVDYNRLNNVFNRYTNGQVIRPVSIFDLNQNSNLYNSSITEKIMTYNPAINNALQYGNATFNRQGVYLNLNYSDKKELFTANLDAYQLSEIRGQGTLNLKKFSLINGNFNLNLAKALKMKKELNLMTGVSIQKTSRSSAFEFEKINLNSTQFTAGIDFEIAKQLYLLAGITSFSSKGNELMPVRNTEDGIIDFKEFKVNGSETTYSGGLRFDFSKKIYLAVMYDQLNYNFEAVEKYKMNQFFIVYNMKF